MNLETLYAFTNIFTKDIFTKDIKQYLYKTKKLIPKNQLFLFH